MSKEGGEAMNNLKAFRIKHRMTQKQLADIANLSQPYLHDLELGNRKGSDATWENISKALGVPVEKLRGGDTDAKAAVS